MKATMIPRKQAPKGPCQHCGQAEHERSCVAELRGQIAERDARLVEQSDTIGKMLGQIAELKRVVPVPVEPVVEPASVELAVEQLEQLEQLEALQATG